MASKHVPHALLPVNWSSKAVVIADHDLPPDRELKARNGGYGHLILFRATLSS